MSGGVGGFGPSCFFVVSRVQEVPFDDVLDGGDWNQHIHMPEQAAGNLLVFGWPMVLEVAENRY